MSHQPRQAFVAYLTSKFGPSGNLGKKAIQKYIHILSSLSGRNLGYEFSFYTYGAFSRDLASDLDILNASNAIDVSYNSFENSYSITPTKSSKELAGILSQEVRKQADAVWDQLAGRTARDLELISTILFVADDEGIKVLGNAMKQRVQALKPKYSLDEITKAQAEVAEKLQRIIS